MDKRSIRKGFYLVAIALLLGIPVTQVIGVANTQLSGPKGSDRQVATGLNYPLPPPVDIDMILEESIFRRCSIREFSTDPVSFEQLSTILWAAYGYRDDGTRTIPAIGSSHSTVLYVLIKNETRKLDVYQYIPVNHSLHFIKQISSFNFGQYTAPVYIGLVWDTSQSDNEYFAGAEIGVIGQNIAFVANALELGGVVNADMLPYAYLTKIGLPSNEIPLILMPLGHPIYPYDFRYRPLDFSPLPRLQYSGMSLKEALEEREESLSWTGQLTQSEEYQMIWSTYGYSYLLDRMESEFIYHIERHRTVPSAHGYYPLRIYAFTESGVSEYYPNILLYLTPYPFIDFLGLPILALVKPVIKEDYRDDLAQVCSQSSLATAPLIIALVVDLERTRPEGNDDFSGENYRWMWYYEAGASAHNVLLEATAWDLTSNLFPLEDKEAFCSLLNLNKDNFDPLFILPLGK